MFFLLSFFLLSLFLLSILFLLLACMFLAPHTLLLLALSTAAFLLGFPRSIMEFSVSCGPSLRHFGRLGRLCTGHVRAVIDKRTG